MGGLSTASGNQSIANGYQSNATGANAVAVGYQAQAIQANTTALGSGSQATFAGATAIGQGAIASGDPATAVGQLATASGNNSVALGAVSTAAGVSSIALGQGANATPNNSVAIGQGVATTRANQVLIGGAGNTYTLPGVASATSLAAQTGATSFLTTDANGNLATSTFNPSSVAALDGRVTALEQNVAALQQSVRRAYEGTAVAIAMGGSALPDNKRYAISANYGTFRGENAFAGSLAIRITDNLVANGAVGTGLARGGVGGRVGATFSW